MSTLTNTQISQTYPGLLKLADSTTGITSSLQAVQDGLGNNTGIQIAQDRFITKNAVSLEYMIPDFYGEGFNTTTGAFPAGSQNIIMAAPIYDPGLYAYSAITNYVQTLSASDTVSMAFYTNQWVNGIGLAPKDLVMSGINITVSATGAVKTTLPSTLSFSGTGSGIYWMVFKITTSGGANPTVRFGGMPNVSNAYIFASAQYGVVPCATNASLFTMPWKGGTGAINDIIYYTSLSSFPSSFSTGDVSAYSSLLVAVRRPGYAFSVIK
jgi:hypothetical protein